MAQRRTRAQAQHQAQHNDQEHKLEVMPANARVVVAQGFECRNLCALGGDLPTQHHIQQKPSHRQKDTGQDRAHDALFFDFRVQHAVRQVLITAMGRHAAVGRQQTVELVNHCALAGQRCQTHRHMVERTFHVVGGA